MENEKSILPIIFPISREVKKMLILFIKLIHMVFSELLLLNK